MLIAKYQISDNAVIGRGQGEELPPNTAEIGYVEVDETNFDRLHSQWRHVQEGPWKFSIDPATGIVSDIPDTRKRLIISIQTADPTEGQPVSIKLETQHADGSHFNFTGSRNLGFRIDGDERLAKLALTSGNRTVTRTLPRAGRIEFFTAEPSVYIVGGEDKFEVLEDWG